MRRRENARSVCLIASAFTAVVGPAATPSPCVIDTQNIANSIATDYPMTVKRHACPLSGPSVM